MRWMEAMLCLASVCQSLQCSNRLRPHQPPAPRTGARSAARAPNRLSSYADQTTTRVEFVGLPTGSVERLDVELANAGDIHVRAARPGSSGVNTTPRALGLPIDSDTDLTQREARSTR